MIFDPAMLNKLAEEWDPEPFNTAMDQAAAQQAAQPLQPAAPAMNFGQMINGAQGMMQVPQPAPAPAPVPQLPAQRPMQPMLPIAPQPQPGAVPNLSAILGIR